MHVGPRIVALGGGTGLSTLLRGLKELTDSITAIVAVMDDGGSSGRLREEMGVLPPGDIRDCLVALADAEPLMKRLFEYRFDHGTCLGGHSFGNLFIAAMSAITGDFELAVKESSRVLLVRGRVLPSTLDSCQLWAKLVDGTEVFGESLISKSKARIDHVYLDRDTCHPLPEALDAIAEADVIVIGPGSLYTSVIPNLLVQGVADSIRRARATRVYVCNVMTQPGETDGYSARDHVEAIISHAGDGLIDWVLVNSAPISLEMQDKYSRENAWPVRWDADSLKELGLGVVEAPMASETELVRHNPQALAREIIKLAERRQG